MNLLWEAILLFNIKNICSVNVYKPYHFLFVKVSSNTESPYDTTIYTQGSNQENENIFPHKNRYTNVGSTIYNSKRKKKKQLIRPLTHKWINKMWWHIYTNEYLAIKRNKPKHAIMQMNLENMLSGRS